VVLQQPWSFSRGLNLVSQPGALLTNTSPHLHLFTRLQFSSFASYPTARADRKQQWWVAAWTEAPATVSVHSMRGFSQCARSPKRLYYVSEEHQNRDLPYTVE
jgi:hypothetical protein